MQNGIDISEFPVPEQALRAFKERGMRPVEIGEGVTRFMSGHDGGVAYRFFIHPKYNARKSKELGYEYFEELEMVEWLVRKNFKPVERVNLLPAELMTRDSHTGEYVGGRYFEAYKRFKEGKETPGTSLASWGVLGEGEIATLSSYGIYTVEQLAAMPPDKVEGRFPLQFVKAWERAKLHEASKDTRKIESALKKQNKEYSDRIAKLEKLVASMAGDEPKKAKGKAKAKAKAIPVVEEEEDEDLDIAIAQSEEVDLGDEVSDEDMFFEE